MLLSTLLVSGLLSWWNFKGCRWRLDLVRHFRVGELSPVYLQIENTKRYLPSYSLTFKLQAELAAQHAAIPMETRLDPGQKTKLLWEFYPQKRGMETIFLQGLISRYPFGFLKKSITDSYSREVIVWPGRIPYEFFADRAGQRWLYGHHKRKGEGVELIHLRDYYHGDSLRRVHWKATARMGRLQVRETEQEHHQAFSLWIDPSPAVWPDPDQFEKMCSFAATLAEDLYQRDQLQAAQIAGSKRIVVGAIEDLYNFLDQLGLVRRVHPEMHKSKPRTMSNLVRFLPGANGTVIARIGEGTIGKAQ